MKDKSLHFNGPINSLSLGNVSINFLKELKKLNFKVSLFPEGDQADFGVYDKIDKEFIEWVKDSAQKRYQTINNNYPVLRNWHIKGSEKRVVPNQYLYTYYEVDQPTQEEINLVSSQKHVFFSSSEACSIFKKRGCENVSFVPLGFDTDFFAVDKELISKEIIHFGIIGKFEKRKNTKKIIQSWIKKYGGNPRYLLTCLIVNPFYKQEEMAALIDREILEGNYQNNVNFLPYLKKNSEVNQLMNSIDIDLSGLSSGEGWNLPAFNATALGKWSIVSNCSSHKDWANESNCILVEPIGKEDCYDDKFFVKGQPFNQGKYYSISEDSIIEALEKSEKKAKTKNLEGEKLQQDFSYASSVKKILSKMFE